MSKIFYRLRSAKNLLEGFNELENQTIYFAHPKQLNDPMEGYRDIFWAGDHIAWKNLFRHYLFCLERLTSSLLIAGEQYEISKNDIPIFGNEEELPTDKYKEQFSKIKESFFSIKSLSNLIDNISSRSNPIRRDELEFYLSSIHFVAMKTIFDVYIEEGLSSERNRMDESCYQHLDRIISKDFLGALEQNKEEKLISEIFAIKRQFQEQIFLLSKYNEKFDKNKPNKNLVVNNFPGVYLDRLNELIFPEWYTACFMSECKNSSVWGHYGENHTGICLMFKSEIKDSKFYLNLNGVSGWGSSGPIFRNRWQELHPIKYLEGFGEIDFFRSMAAYQYRR